MNSQQQLERTTMTSIRVFSPTKINLGLTVRQRREDGFHDLDTVFQAVNWGDELICHPSPPDAKTTLLCNTPEVPVDERNLVIQAWQLLREQWGERVGPTRFALHKNVPMGAGLGGGSANGAAALVGLRRLWKLPLSAAELETLAARLGSDCAFFIRGGTQYAQGRGEILEPIPNALPKLYLVVVHPGFGSPTGEAFKRIAPRDWVDAKSIRKICKLVGKGDLTGLDKETTNIFETILSDLDERYGQLRESLRASGLGGVMMTGSGSSFFGWTQDLNIARRAKSRLSRCYPTVVIAPLRRCGVRLLPHR